MASYFDLQPRGRSSKDGDGALSSVDHNNQEEIGRLGLLTPQIERILEDLDLDENKSSSDSEDGSDEDEPDQDLDDKDAKHDRKSGLRNVTTTTTTADTSASSHQSKAATSPLSRSGKSAGIPLSARPGVKGAKHPHLARFQSLRSMLFNTHIEQNMQREKEEEAQNKWKDDSKQRRPKTPEKEEKGVMKRMGSRLKRLGSKEAPSVGTVKEGEVAEHGGMESPGRNEEKGICNGRRGSDDDDDDDDLDHSDIEELVRWVTRRDPPSDGERRHTNRSHQTETSDQEAEEETSDHESLGNSDVDDLVRWISRKERRPSHLTAKEPQTTRREKGEENKEEEEEKIPTTTTTINNNYSDASTETDSETELSSRHGDGDDDEKSIDQEEVDELVRWISHKGPRAGPVRDSSRSHASGTIAQQRIDNENVSTAALSSSSSLNDEDTAALVRWVTRKDDTSGESDVEGTGPVVGKVGTGGTGASGSISGDGGGG